MTAENVIQLRHPSGPVSVPGSPGWTYETGPHPGIRRETTSGRGDEKTIVVTDVLDWCPLVSERLVTMRADGTPDGLYYRVTVGADTALVSHKEVASGEIWERMPDAYGTGTKQVRDILTSVITAQGVRLPRTLAVTRTGWHTTPDDGVIYVSADGRTAPSGVKVEIVGLDPGLAAAAAPVDLPDGHNVADVISTVADNGGWAPLLGIAAGARAFGQSLRPVPAALVVQGEPNTGKTCTAVAGRMLALNPTWPPPVTAKMSEDSVTDIEMKIDAEADMPTLIDDLALTLDAPALIQRDAVSKLERVIRAVGNGGAMRGRRKRDLTAQTQRYVRTIPVITAQALPPAMQASLYRRAVVLHLVAGDANWRWWGQVHESGELARVVGPGLREIGARIVARLAEVDDPASLLADADAAGKTALSECVDREIPGWADSETGMVGVVTMAGAMLGGLALVADAAGVDREPLLSAVAGPLARSLAIQAATMEDRRQATDDLPAAVGDILRAALINRRAHLRNHRGDLDGASGPDGLTAQEMGLRAAGQDGYLTVWEGYGPPLYWLPDHNAVGIGSAALHDLVRASGDQRAAGYRPQSLVAALGRAGALWPSPERGRQWSRNHRLTGGDCVRMVWIKPAVVWPDLGDEQAPPASDTADPAAGPSGDAPAAGPAVTPAAGDRPDTLPPAAAAAVSEVAAPPLPTGPALALGCDRDVIYLGDGRDREPGDAYDSMSALLSLAAELMPSGGTVAITGEVAEMIGYPERPENARPGRPGKQPAGNRQECAAVAEARAAGWTSSAAGIGAWTAWHGADRPSIAVVVLPWLDYKRMRVSGAPYLRAEDGPLEASYLLARYRQETGVPYVMTAGTSGTNMIRARYTDRPATPGRRRAKTPRLKWDGSGTPAEIDQEAACRWGRALTDAERGMSHVIEWDLYKAYLAAESGAILAVDTLTETGVPETGFSADIPGYWQVSAEWAPYEMLPALTGREGTGPYWLTTPTVELLLKTGMPEEAITNAWLPENGKGSRILRPVAERLRDGIAAIPTDCQDPEEARVRDALKATYTELYGMLRRGTRWVQRRDWSDTVIAVNRANLFRRAVQVGTETGRWPIEIDTDCLYYACNSDDPETENPAPHILKTGNRLGMFVAKKTYTMDEFLTREGVRCHA
jgi:hypothetical protein